MRNLMVLVALAVLVVLGCSQSTQHNRISDAEWNRQLAEVEKGVEKLGSDIEKVWQDPKIIESLALVEFYEQELKKPVPEPTREETLRELDRLWDEAAKGSYVSDPEKEKELLRVAGLKIGE